MKNKKNFYLNLLIFIGSPIVIGVGIALILLYDNNRIIATGGLLICAALLVLLNWLIRLLALHSANKEKRAQEREEQLKKQMHEKKIDAAVQGVQDKTEYPETNTVKMVDTGMEFFAEGRYVCEKDFKGIPGHHFAFEITSTKLKHKPDDYDDVCDYESNGIFVVIGYHDGHALEQYANKNGVILQDSVENSVGKAIALKPDDGYVAYVWTADGDEIDHGVVKILKSENDVLTVYFYLDVYCGGLSDAVEGVVELKKDTGETARDIQSIIGRIKRRLFNVISVSAEEVQAIKQVNPFLPKSYIEFISTVGFADLDWIDIGRNANTPDNLYENEPDGVKDIMSKSKNARSIDDFYFIGIDSDGRYYAFSKNPDDKKVYLFADDMPDAPPYESFEDLLIEILEA